jgi:hypothetical protein
VDEVYQPMPHKISDQVILKHGIEVLGLQQLLGENRKQYVTLIVILIIVGMEVVVNLTHIHDVLLNDKN